jgi:hypothetical protein
MDHFARVSLVENIAKKEPQSFFQCGSFDHLDLQSLKQLHIVFSWFTNMNFKDLRGLIYCWKDLENTFPAVYYMPQKNLNLQPQNKKETFAVV